ncbi:unnamed protein product [Brachionus calyciflorus]|uniref:Uncharacterized protein n=1 Tax=Brachionus calyciflorus TaxID=104777 RepID=A0A814GX26_9BILA|nr:unnamed protein product [Brachionus calyciflorus]
MTNQKSSISVDKINKVKKDGVLDKNEIKSSDSNKVAKKIVKKAISQIVAKEKSSVKNSSKYDDNVKSVNNEQPKPFKIPKLKKPVDSLENLIIKPGKILRIFFFVKKKVK